MQKFWKMKEKTMKKFLKKIKKKERIKIVKN